MKWNGTEFLYHPQLLQVQIIAKKPKIRLQNKQSCNTEDVWGKKDNFKGLKRKK